MLVVSMVVTNTISELVGALADGVVRTGVVVVTHLGFFGGRNTSSLDGVFGDLNFFPERWARSLCVDGGEVVNLNLFGVVTRLEDGRSRDVYSRVVLGTVVLAVLAFSNVNGTNVRVAGRIDLDASVCELGKRMLSARCRTILLLHESLRMDTGTAVVFLFTRDSDLFFDAFLASVRKFSGDGERRMLPFPSGLLFGKFDLNLLVDGCCGGLRLCVLICGRKDAEGHGNAGFKVQVGGLR
jgi:hypothetical protein